ncbi:MAG: hypothetical protein V6Z89_18445 [Desulfobacter sp.]
MTKELSESQMNQDQITQDRITQDQIKSDAIAINEAQLLLAEKRTALAILRTGIAVIALPMSITSFLIAFSKHYDVFSVLHFLIPLSLMNVTLGAFGIYLIYASVRRMHHYDRLIHDIKTGHSVIGRFLG